MTGFEQFLSVFGKVTVAQIVIGIFVIIFGIKLYKEIKKYFVKRYESEKEKDEQLKECLEQVKKYPQYRQQSIDMQQHFQNEINSLKDSQNELKEHQKETTAVLQSLQEDITRRDRNKLQDRLLQSYRYYTDKEQNPSQSWTDMEAQAFWALFKDYEDAGGDGYMHTVVQPAMQMLKIIYR